MTGELQVVRLAFPTMTRIALELLVLGNAVRERLECSVGRAYGDRFGCLGRCDNDRGLIRLFETASRKHTKRAKDHQGFEKRSPGFHLKVERYKPPIRTCELE